MWEFVSVTSDRDVKNKVFAEAIPKTIDPTRHILKTVTDKCMRGQKSDRIDRITEVGIRIRSKMSIRD